MSISDHIKMSRCVIPRGRRSTGWFYGKISLHWMLRIVVFWWLRYCLWYFGDIACGVGDIACKNYNAYRLQLSIVTAEYFYAYHLHLCMVMSASLNANGNICNSLWCRLHHWMVPVLLILNFEISQLYVRLPYCLYFRRPQQSTQL